MPNQPPINFGEARARLRRLFRIREIVRELEEFGYSSQSDLLFFVARHAPAPGDSPHEAEIVRRLDLLASVREEATALAKLMPDQQRFAELRWGRYLPYRAIAYEMHRATSTVHKLERLTLAAFIRALGCEPSPSSPASREKAGQAPAGRSGCQKIETSVRAG